MTDDRQCLTTRLVTLHCVCCDGAITFQRCQTLYMEVVACIVQQQACWPVTQQQMYGMCMCVGHALHDIVIGLTMQALQALTWGQRLSAGFVAAVALLAVAASRSARAASSATWVGLIAAALTGAAVSWQCSVFRQKFIFVDYVHAGS